MLKAHSTDEELMALYQEGSEEAFKELYSRHSAKVYGYLRARSKSDEEATDLFQEVFIKVHRSRKLYSPSLTVLPWIFSVTHSVLIDGKRSHKRKNEVFDYDFDQLRTAEVAENKVNEISPVIEQLQDKQGAAIKMRYLEEKTFEEIAESLKTSPLNVRQMISRGVKNLRQLIREGEKP